jgi:hypothetical protein
MRLRAPILAIFSALALAAAGCGGAAPAAVADDAKRAEDLAAEVKALRELVPDQAHIMADVGYHFTNLWSAGKAENWPLADFYLGETKSHLRWAVRAKPVRKDAAGRDFPLLPILEAIENAQFVQMKKAIDGKDRPAFEAVYKDTLTLCYSCHKVADKPYLRPQVPTHPEVGIINFDPRADWPR